MIELTLNYPDREEELKLPSMADVMLILEAKRDWTSFVIVGSRSDHERALR